jgi:hypothetical protein
MGFISELLSCFVFWNGSNFWGGGLGGFGGLSGFEGLGGSEEDDDGSCCMAYSNNIN